MPRSSGPIASSIDEARAGTATPSPCFIVASSDPSVQGRPALVPVVLTVAVCRPSSEQTATTSAQVIAEKEKRCAFVAVSG